MTNYGVILRKLRLLNKLQLRAAAARIGRSAGWLSEIENGNGSSRLHTQEFDRIVAAYGGEAYRKQFGIWVAKAHHLDTPPIDRLQGGAVLKYLRKKAGLSLESAAKQSAVSVPYLSRLENGERRLIPELRDKLMQLYGYSPQSFKNFTTEDKRAKNIPSRYKLALVLKQMNEGNIEKLLAFALSLTEQEAA
jgi:transcriptional regulator with XRE-family HTH domain